MTRVTASEARALLAPKKPAKYKNKRVKVDGYSFDSIAEATRYSALKHMMRGGYEIDNLKVHPAYELHDCTGAVVGKYVADFSYWCKRRGCEIVEDVKGVRTDLYKWKKRHFESEYRTRIEEIAAK